MRGAMPYQTPSYGMLMRGGSMRGAGPGRGGFMSGPARGAGGPPKRKPGGMADSGMGAGPSGGDMKMKMNLDSWSSPPIAQQPLGQAGGMMDGYGDASAGADQWYQDVGFHHQGAGAASGTPSGWQ